MDKEAKIERYVRQGGRWKRHFKETDIEELHGYADLDKIRIVSEIVTENGKSVGKIVGWYRPEGEYGEYEKGFNDGYDAGFASAYDAGFEDGKRKGYKDGCEAAGLKIEY